MRLEYNIINTQNITEIEKPKVNFTFKHNSQLKVIREKGDPQVKQQASAWGTSDSRLLYWIKKSGLDKFLPKLLKKGVLYVGVSAGSIVAGPNIDLCYLKGFDDPSVVKLKNTKSLNFVPFTIFPHYEPKWKKVVEKNKNKLPEKLVFLTDDQAISLENKKIKLVGKRKSKMI